MTDIIDRLRSLQTMSMYPNSGCLYAELNAQRDEAADEIARLRDELKGWEAWRSNVLTEHTQIANGLREDLKLTQGQRNASNREIERLRDQLAATELARDHFRERCERADFTIAAAQAYGAKLHEALTACCREIRSLELSTENGPNGVDGDGQWYYFTTTHPAVFDAMEKLAEIIAPSDAAALRERLAAELAACAKICRDKKSWGNSSDVWAAKLLEEAAVSIEKRSDAIRALGGE